MEVLTSADANAPESPSTADLTRAEALLRSASMLLASGSHWEAAQLIHTEIAGLLRVPSPRADAYPSQRAAEEAHERLLREARTKIAHPLPRARYRELRLRLPQWASWAAVITVTAGLTLRYALGVVSRTNWQRQHPEGNWISRYYPAQDFKGNPLVRYDVGIDYNWGKGAPAQAMDRDRWSARWDTCVVVAADLDLSLTLNAVSSGELFVDDAGLIDLSRHGGKRTETILLQRGVRHLRVDFQDMSGRARLSLEGLNFEGTDAYQFRRPILSGDEVRCN